MKLKFHHGFEYSPSPHSHFAGTTFFAKGSIMSGKRFSTRATVGTVIALALMTVAVSQLEAQGKNPLDEIMAKLNELVALLTPPSGPTTVVLTTPLVRVTETDIYQCLLTNVGTEPIAPLNFRALDSGGGQTGSGFSASVPPGGTGGGGGNGPKFVRCEFTFEGTADAVRAHLVLSKDSAGNTTTLSVDAR